MLLARLRAQALDKNIFNALCDERAKGLKLPSMLTTTFKMTYDTK